MEIEICSEMGVELVDSMGSDLTIVRAARVSFNKDAIEMGQSEQGLLGFLIRNKHVSPLEHVQATFRFEVPIFVAREHMRHRVQAYNEWSGRYSQLRPKFYCPTFDRGIHQIGKPGAYTFEPGTDDEVLTIWREMRHSYSTAWTCYQYLLDQGIGKEIARNCLPVGIYTSYFASANLRGWLNYLALRTTPDALFEIRESAARVETLLHTIAPHTLNLWDEYGRQTL